MQTLLIIALNNISNPAATAMYFDKSIISLPPSHDDSSNSAQPKPVK